MENQKQFPHTKGHKGNLVQYHLTKTGGSKQHFIHILRAQKEHLPKNKEHLVYLFSGSNITETVGGDFLNWMKLGLWPYSSDF